MGNKLVPLVPMYDSLPVLKGGVNLNVGAGQIARAGDIYPSLGGSLFERPGDFIKNTPSSLTPLFDPGSDDPAQFFDGYAHWDTAGENPELFGMVPEGSCVHIKIYGDYWQWNNAANGCTKDHIEAWQGSLIYDYWSYDLPEFADKHYDNYACFGGTINAPLEGRRVTNLPPNTFAIGHGPDYWDNESYEVTEYRPDCSTPGGETPVMTVEIPEIPSLPDGTPPPPPPPTVPTLYGGVVTTVGTPEEATTDFVPFEGGYKLDLNIYCPCEDGEPGPPGADGAPGAPGADGAPGEQGPPGTGGYTPMIPKEADLPQFDPEDGKWKIVPRTIHLPDDGEGNSMAPLYEVVLSMLMAIWMRVPPPIGELEDVGIGIPEEGTLA